MRVDLSAITDNGPITNYGKGTDIDIFPDSGLGRNTGKWVNPSFARFRWFVELQQLGYTLIGILNTDKRCADRLFKYDILVN